MEVLRNVDRQLKSLFLFCSFARFFGRRVTQGPQGPPGLWGLVSLSHTLPYDSYTPPRTKRERMDGRKGADVARVSKPRERNYCWRREIRFSKKNVRGILISKTREGFFDLFASLLGSVFRESYCENNDRHAPAKLHFTEVSERSGKSLIFFLSFNVRHPNRGLQFGRDFFLNIHFIPQHFRPVPLVKLSVASQSH